MYFQFNNEGIKSLFVLPRMVTQIGNFVPKSLEIFLHRVEKFCVPSLTVKVKDRRNTY